MILYTWCFDALNRRQRNHSHTVCSINSICELCNHLKNASEIQTQGKTKTKWEWYRREVVSQVCWPEVAKGQRARRVCLRFQWCDGVNLCNAVCSADFKCLSTSTGPYGWCEQPHVHSHQFPKKNNVWEDVEKEQTEFLPFHVREMGLRTLDLRGLHF